MGPLSKAFCISKLDMPTSKLFRYTQISDFLHKICKTQPNGPQITTYEQRCGQVDEQRGENHSDL